MGANSVAIRLSHLSTDDRSNSQRHHPPTFGHKSVPSFLEGGAPFLDLLRNEKARHPKLDCTAIDRRPVGAMLHDPAKDCSRGTVGSARPSFRIISVALGLNPAASKVVSGDRSEMLEDSAQRIDRHGLNTSVLHHFDHVVGSLDQRPKGGISVFCQRQRTVRDI
jgi:hypothetical protein